MVKIMMIGHLGGDAQVNNVNGKNVINFSLAHSYKTKEGQEQTKWVSCSCWLDLLTLVPYLKKGGLVYVEGTPDAKIYTTSQGVQKASLMLLQINELRAVCSYCAQQKQE